MQLAFITALLLFQWVWCSTIVQVCICKIERTLFAQSFSPHHHHHHFAKWHHIIHHDSYHRDNQIWLMDSTGNEYAGSTGDNTQSSATTSTYSNNNT